jgi:hypothetical protein
VSVLVVKRMGELSAAGAQQVSSTAGPPQHPQLVLFSSLIDCFLV